jgi:hypothetical protein
MSFSYLLNHNPVIQFTILATRDVKTTTSLNCINETSPSTIYAKMPNLKQNFHQRVQAVCISLKLWNFAEIHVLQVTTLIDHLTYNGHYVSYKIEDLGLS